MKFVLVEMFFRLKPLSCICMYAFSLHVEALFIGSDAFVGLLETFTVVIIGRTEKPELKQKVYKVFAPARFYYMKKSFLDFF